MAAAAEGHWAKERTGESLLPFALAQSLSVAGHDGFPTGGIEIQRPQNIEKSVRTASDAAKDEVNLIPLPAGVAE